MEHLGFDGHVMFFQEKPIEMSLVFVPNGDRYIASLTLTDETAALDQSSHTLDYIKETVFNFYLRCDQFRHMNVLVETEKEMDFLRQDMGIPALVMNALMREMYSAHLKKPDQPPPKLQEHLDRYHSEFLDCSAKKAYSIRQMILELFKNHLMEYTTRTTCQ